MVICHSIYALHIINNDFNGPDIKIITIINKCNVHTKVGIYFNKNRKCDNGLMKEKQTRLNAIYFFI